MCMTKTATFATSRLETDNTVGWDSHSDFIGEYNTCDYAACESKGNTFTLEVGGQGCRGLPPGKESGEGLRAISPENL